jgi:hypothetical protein
MQKIKLTSPRVFSDGRDYMTGDVIELAANEAARLIAAGQAEPIAAPAKLPSNTRRG